MNLKKINIFAILAVFCVIISACAVSAVEDGNFDANDVYGTQDGHEGQIIPPDYSHDEAQQAAGGDIYLDGSQDGHNGTIIPPDYAHNEQKMANHTVPAAGENVTNTTATGVSNHTANATSTHKLPATGNPIVILLAVSAIVGGYAVLRRKN